MKFFDKDFNFLRSLFDKIYSCSYNELRLITMMKVNVSEIVDLIGQKVTFEFKVNPEDIGPINKDCKIEGPIIVKGTAVNTGLCFCVAGQITCKLFCTCDRCLDDFVSSPIYTFEEEFTQDEGFARTKEINYFNGDIIDIGDLVRDIIISAQPIRYLCSEDCKGLCPVCGANLNKTECDCNRVSVDPRLAILQDLFKKDK